MIWAAIYLNQFFKNKRTISSYKKSQYIGMGNHLRRYSLKIQKYNPPITLLYVSFWYLGLGCCQIVSLRSLWKNMRHQHDFFFSLCQRRLPHESTPLLRAIGLREFMWRCAECSRDAERRERASTLNP